MTPRTSAPTRFSYGLWATLVLVLVAIGGALFALLTRQWSAAMLCGVVAYLAADNHRLGYRDELRRWRDANQPLPFNVIDNVKENHS